MTKIIRIKDLYVFKEKVKDEYNTVYFVEGCGKILDIKWKVKESRLLDYVEVVQITDVQDYLNGGEGSPVVRRFTSNTLPEVFDLLLP